MLPDFSTLRPDQLTPVKPVINNPEKAQAVETLTAAIEADPKNLSAWVERAALYHKLGLMGSAMADAAAAVMVAPDNAVVANQLGRLLQENGQWEQAAICFARAAAIDGTKPEYFLNLGLAMQAVGLVESAQELYQSAVQLDAKSAAAWEALTGLMAQLGQFEPVLELIGRAGETGLETANLARIQGASLIALGRFEEAKPILASVVERQPDDAQARYLVTLLASDTLPKIHIDALMRRTLDVRLADVDMATLSETGTRVPGLIRRLVLEKSLKQAVDAPVTRKLTAVLDLGCDVGLIGMMLYDLTLFLKGVDSSAHLTELTRRKGVYHELEVRDALQALRSSPRLFDLITAAELFSKFGDLSEAMRLVRERLLPGGMLMCALDALPEGVAGDFDLDATGHFRHSTAYVERLGREAGFSELEIHPEILRYVDEQPVKGMVVRLVR